jgi:hypothetical protein
MTARTAKNEIRRQIREKMEVLKVPMEAPYILLVREFLHDLVRMQVFLSFLPPFSLVPLSFLSRSSLVPLSFLSRSSLPPPWRSVGK